MSRLSLAVMTLTAIVMAAATADASRALEDRTAPIAQAWSYLYQTVTVIGDLPKKAAAATNKHVAHAQQFTLPPGVPPIPGPSQGRSPSQLPSSLPQACNSLLPLFLSNTPPSPSSICTLWSQVSPCINAILQDPTWKALLPPKFPTNVVSIVQPMIDGICATVDGRACAMVFESIVNMTTCAGIDATRNTCPPQCVRKAAQSIWTTATCEPSLTLGVVTDFCSGCFTSIVNGALSFIKGAKPLMNAINNGGDDLGIDIDLDELNGPLVLGIQAFRQAICPKTASGTLCLVSLGLVGSSGSQLVDAINSANSDSFDSLYATGSLMPTICLSVDNQQCFNRIVMGSVAAAGIDAGMRVARCRKTRGIDCEVSISSAQNAMVAAWALRTSRLCSKNAAGQLCLALPSIAQATVPGFVGCANQVGGSWRLNSTCQQILNTTTASWGCCAKIVVQKSVAIMSNYDALAIYNKLPAPCSITLVGTPVQKTLRMAIAWALLVNNQTLYNATLNSAVTDIAAKLGLSPDFIINPRLVSAATAPASSSRRAFRFLQAATGGDAALTFGIQTTDTTMTSQASSAFDSDVAANNMQLVSTNAALQEAGVLPAGSSATPTSAPAAALGTSDGPSVVLIGAVVGGVVALVLIVVIVAVVMRGKSGGASRSSQDTSGTHYQPMKA